MVRSLANPMQDPSTWIHPKSGIIQLKVSCCMLKPIFHYDAKYLASGVGVGQCPRRQNVVFEIPTCWYLGANAKCKVCVTPNAKLKICISPDANPRRQSVEYKWRWVPNTRFSRWPCTFHVVYVNFICVGHPA